MSAPGVLHGDGVSWLMLGDGTMVSVRGPQARSHAEIIAGAYAATSLVPRDALATCASCGHETGTTR